MQSCLDRLKERAYISYIIKHLLIYNGKVSYKPLMSLKPQQPILALIYHNAEHTDGVVIVQHFWGRPGASVLVA